MSLSIHRRIHSRHVIGIKKLVPDLPVYLLTGERGSKIVIKRDRASNVDRGKKENDPRSMRRTFKNMAAIDKSVKAVQLTQGELRSIARFTSEWEHGSKNLNPFRWDNNIGAATKLHNDLKAPGTAWIKTNFFEGLVDLESAASDARNGAKRDKTGVRAIAKALSAPDGLEKLGRIIAVDAFNGNNDRFNLGPIHDYSAKPERTKIFDIQQNKFVDVETWRLVNAGNVACFIQDEVLKPAGMDPWSGSSPLRNFETDAGPDIADLDIKWTGRLLADDQRADREQIGYDVVDDLETLLGPRNRKLFLAKTTRLPRDAGERITRGIEQGTLQLKRHLLSKSRQQPGLVKRMETLGWATRDARGRSRPAPPKGRRPG